MKSLPSLPTGEGWIWSPEFLGIFERIKIRQRETFHPDREKLGINFVMPPLAQTDLADFIKSFSAKTSLVKNDNKPVFREAPVYEPPRNIHEHCISRENHGEAIRQKVREIEKLTDRIAAARKALGEAPSNGQIAASSAKVDMWVEKLGNGGASRILKFLSDKSGMRFTRSQIALAVGMSAKGGSYLTYISTLKRNNLIQEDNRELQINPDLLS